MIPIDYARCIGVPAGPSGHQNAPECQNCERRQAPRFPDSSYIEPSKEVPCPNRINPEVE